MDGIWQARAEAGETARERRITALFDRNPDRFREFSMGMKQRLGVAAALLFLVVADAMCIGDFCRSER